MLPPGVTASEQVDEVSPGMAVAAAKEARERKATKADDTQVPVEMWAHHFLDDPLISIVLEDMAADARLPFALRLLELLRPIALIAWQRMTRRSMLKWLAAEMHSTLGLNADEYHVGGNLRVWYSKPTHELLPPIEHTRWEITQPGGLASDLQWDPDARRFSWSTESGAQRFARWCKQRASVLHRDRLVCARVLGVLAGATWWEWGSGSVLFYWRWPKHYQQRARDGIPFAFTGKPPRYKVPQQGVKDAKVREMIMNKLEKVLKRGYLQKGEVKFLTSFFHVPKGDDDIRMVYDGTKSGFNDSVQAPHFPLPTVSSLLRHLVPGTYMTDLDIGEMFLNYPLHPSLQPYVGIDLTLYTDPDDPRLKGVRCGKVWFVWDRAAMGLHPSPYQANQGMSVAEEVIRGDRKDERNIFRWEHVRLNLPGSASYTPTLPWVSKVRRDGSTVAADFVTYVDDVRPSGPDKKESWLAGRRVGSKLNWLGSQDAPRKRRDSSMQPGAWTGAVVWTSEGQVRLMVAQDKWDKARQSVKEVAAMIQNSTDGTCSKKRLEQIRGFLNFVFQVYKGMRPHLVVFHLTIDSWRPGRDNEGWRMLGGKARYELEPPMIEDAPVRVKMVPRLKDDVEALTNLMDFEEPPPRRILAEGSMAVYYGFGDASSPGFGASFQLKDGIWYRYGQWCSEVSESETSNWRELANLVYTLEVMCQERIEVRASEIFLFTDNSTAEACWWKGTSKSRKLFELILKLKRVEMTYELVIHVIHVSGRRMIAQGTDGLSRGDFLTGVMKGEPMMSHVPLHRDAFERSQALREWAGSLSDGGAKDNFQILTPEDWFTSGHGYGNYIWVPPPAAADVVVEQLGKAIWTSSTGPKKLNDCWRNISGRCRGQNCQRWIHGKDGIFCANFFHKRDDYAPCLNIWCAKCFVPEGTKEFPIRKLIDEEGVELKEYGKYRRFLEARPGDNLLTPFQCEECHFRNLLGRDRNLARWQDREILALMRRANLDAFWAREPSTVNHNLNGMKRLTKFEERLALPSTTPKLGPFPVEDSFGMGAAIAILDRSLDPGFTEEFVQYETFRKLRGVVTNSFQAGVNGLGDTVGAYEKHKMWISSVPTHLFWFSRFMTGLHKRVGDARVQDKAVTLEMMIAMESILESRWQELSKRQDAKGLLATAEIGAWVHIGFVLGLRGEEMPLIETAGTSRSIEGQDLDCGDFDIVVSGRTKGHHVSGLSFGLPCMCTTGATGLQPGKWVARLVAEKRKMVGGKRGRLFQRESNPPKLTEFEEDFFRLLECVQLTTEFIDKNVNVREEFGLMRSLRRGMTAHCLNFKVDRDLIRTFNRWRLGFDGDGRAPSLNIVDHYAGMEAIRPTLLSLSQGL